MSETDRQTDRDGDREKYGVLRGRSNSSEAQTSAWGEGGIALSAPINLIRIPDMRSRG